ncbi:MAG: hypothetical protein RLW68_00870 [Devosia marina]|uniref:hypothetical protein n=1 Tax=Devosia marina TaxID=2683198 RepID=UPI0032EE5FA3
MTLSEFKAWFEGFTEGMDGAPTEKQFKRIKAKVAEITGTPITQTVFIDRYRDYYRQWGSPWYGGNVAFSSAGSVGSGVTDAVMQNNGGGLASLPAEFDSHAAMYAVGKSDAEAA